MMDVASDPDIIKDSEILEKPDILKGPRDPFSRDLIRFKPGNGAPFELDLPFRWLIEPSQYVENSGFSSAVRSDERCNASAVKGEVELRDGFYSAESLREICGFKNDFAHGAYTPRRLNRLK